MTHPPRLIDRSDDALVVGMLRAARNERHRHGAAARAIGVLAASGVAMTGARTAGAAAAQLSSFTLLKCVLIGLVAGTLSVGAAKLLSTDADPASTREPLRRISAPAPSASVTHAPLPPPSPPPGSRATNAQPHRAPRRAPNATKNGASPARHVAQNSAESSLMREVESIDRARTLLARGDVGAVLHELDGYERTTPNGVLEREAIYLRLEASLAAGDERAACRAAERLAREDPSGIHADRVRSTLSSSCGSE